MVVIVLFFVVVVVAGVAAGAVVVACCCYDYCWCCCCCCWVLCIVYCILSVLRRNKVATTVCAVHRVVSERKLVLGPSSEILGAAAFADAVERGHNQLMCVDGADSSGTRVHDPQACRGAQKMACNKPPANSTCCE